LSGTVFTAVDFQSDRTTGAVQVSCTPGCRIFLTHRVHLGRKDGETMSLLAEHHVSAEMIMIGAIVLGLAVGALAGYILGVAMDNIGVGVSLGSLGGLVAGIIAGVMVSDREE